MNNLSNRSSVLPILCEHGQFSAILERTQSDHSDCRHWMEGVSTDDETGYRVVLFQHLTRQKPATRSKVTGY